MNVCTVMCLFCNKRYQKRWKNDLSSVLCSKVVSGERKNIFPVQSLEKSSLEIHFKESAGSPIKILLCSTLKITI